MDLAQVTRGTSHSRSEPSKNGIHHPHRCAGVEITLEPKGDHQRLRRPFLPVRDRRQLPELVWFGAKACTPDLSSCCYMSDRCALVQACL